MTHFEHIEKITGVKIPTFLKNILRKTGFDSIGALKEINAELIEKIEQTVTLNLDEFSQYLRKTEYASKPSSTREFKFLLGHRNIIETVQKKLTDLKEKKKEQLEQQRESKTVKFTDIQLITKFSTKIVNYYDKKQLKAASLNFFSVQKLTANINKKEHTLQRNGKTIKLRVKCPFCVKKYWCGFSGYWNITNFVHHLKTHKKNLLNIQAISSAPIAIPVSQNSNQLAIRTPSQTQNLAQSDKSSDLASETPFQRFNSSSIEAVKTIRIETEKSSALASARSSEKSDLS